MKPTIVRKGHIIKAELSANEQAYLKQLADEMNEHYKREYARKYDEALKRTESFCMHFAQDALIKALHKTMGFGPKRQEIVNLAWIDEVQGMSDLVMSVLNEDPQLWEAEERIDREVLAAIGKENFVPFEERYEMAEFIAAIKEV